MSWQRASIQAAAAYLRERIAAGDADARTRSVYEGLLEVLDPARRTVRLRRELAESTRVEPIPADRERRASGDRRAQPDRRQTHAGGRVSDQHRTERDRRSGTDRRSR